MKNRKVDRLDLASIEEGLSKGLSRDHVFMAAGLALRTAQGYLAEGRGDRSKDIVTPCSRFLDAVERGEVVARSKLQERVIELAMRPVQKTRVSFRLGGCLNKGEHLPVDTAELIRFLDAKKIPVQVTVESDLSGELKALLWLLKVKTEKEGGDHNQSPAI